MTSSLDKWFKEFKTHVVVSIRNINIDLNVNNYRYIK